MLKEVSQLHSPDEFKKPTGRLKIETIDDSGNVISSAEYTNLVMDNARLAMAKLMSGDGNKINRFMIGNDGYVSGAPREPNESGGYTSSRSELFSRSKTTGDFYTYDAIFEIQDGFGGRGEGKLYKNNLQIPVSDYVETSHKPSMSISQLGQEVTYTIVIPKQCANNPDGTTIEFSEAALFADDLIFSMKCFQKQEKNAGNASVITWSIIF